MQIQLSEAPSTLVRVSCHDCSRLLCHIHSPPPIRAEEKPNMARRPATADIPGKLTSAEGHATQNGGACNQPAMAYEREDAWDTGTLHQSPTCKHLQKGTEAHQKVLTSETHDHSTRKQPGTTARHHMQRLSDRAEGIHISSAPRAGG